MSGLDAPSRPAGDREASEPGTPGSIGPTPFEPAPRSSVPHQAYSAPKPLSSPAVLSPKSAPEVLAVPAHAKPELVVCMPHESCLCGLLLGLVVTVLFELLSLGVDSWTQFNTGPELRDYGLHYCNDCPPAFEHTSWACLKEQTCTVNSDFGLCKNAKDMGEASGAYIGLTVTSLIFLFLTIERVLYHYCKIDYGLNWLVYVFALIFWLAQALAVLLWFGLSGAEFQADCAYRPISTDRWELCATDGPSIAIVTAFCVTVCLVATLAIHRRRTKEVTTPLNIDTIRICSVDYKCCLLFPLFGMALILAILIATIATDDWVTVSGQKGSLYTLQQYKQYTDYGYDCIMREHCNRDDGSDTCSTFDDLETASRIFAVLEILCLFVWALWLEPLVGVFFNRDYGLPALNYSWGVVLLMLHSAAIGSWFEVSEAKFSKTGCDADPTGRWNICAEAGPALAVLNTLLIVVVLVVYTALYKLRYGVWKPAKTEEKEEEPAQ